MANNWLWLRVADVPALTTLVSIFETLPIDRSSMPTYFDSVMQDKYSVTKLTSDLLLHS